jgi:hypothetical protein
MNRLISLVVIFVLMAANHAFANQTLVGLPWEGLYIQEYWQNKNPHYLLYNSTDHDSVVNIKDKAYNISARSFKNIDVADLKGHDLVPVTTALFTKNKSAVTALLDFLVFPEIASDKIITTYGLNGSGGRNIHPQSQIPYDRNGMGLWIEQDQLEYEGGKPFVLKLMVKDNAGRITFPRYKKQDIPSAPEEIWPEDVKSDSLTVEVTKEEYIINVDQPAVVKDVHQIELYFKAPPVDQPTLVVFSGFDDIKGVVGFGITRGIAVVPESN